MRLTFSFVFFKFIVFEAAIYANKDVYNLRNTLWQKWGGHAHPIATPLLLVHDIHAHSFRVWPYSCLLISDRKYFIIVSIYVAEVVV